MVVNDFSIERYNNKGNIVVTQHWFEALAAVSALAIIFFRPINYSVV